MNTNGKMTCSATGQDFYYTQTEWKTEAGTEWNVGSFPPCLGPHKLCTRGFQVLMELQEGNARFVRGEQVHPRQDAQTRHDLVANGQRPKAVVIACSDSRASPGIVFDAGLGDIFSVRSAGQVLDDVGLGTIEFAIHQFGCPLLVVLAHERCGAVAAALRSTNGDTLGSPSLDLLVARVRKNIPAVLHNGYHDGGDIQELPLIANAVAVVNMIREKSPSVSQAVMEGKLLMTVGIHHLNSGEVDFLQV